MVVLKFTDKLKPWHNILWYSPIANTIEVFHFSRLANACPPFWPGVERVQGIAHLLDPSQGQSRGGVRQAGKREMEFFGNSFFYPHLFIVTGFLIDPVVFFQSITVNFPLASAVIDALLVGQVDSSTTVNRAVRLFSSCASDDVVTLTLPHVAANTRGRRNTTGSHEGRSAPPTSFQFMEQRYSLLPKQT
jgi:hypothetical protein